MGGKLGRVHAAWFTAAKRTIAIEQLVLNCISVVPFRRSGVQWMKSSGSRNARSLSISTS
jgi:hypothetical protein